MTFSIQIDPADPHGSDHSLSDEEDSSGVQVSVPSDSGSHEYQDFDEWAHLSFPDELKPSDSASRPRTSHSNRSLHGSRSKPSRRQPARRQMISGGESYGPRARRHHSPESPGSADSDEYATPYPRNTHDRRWPGAPPPPPGYAQSASSGPSFNNAYPPGHGGPFPHPNGAALSDQLIRFGHGNPAGQPYGAPPYPYGPHVQPHGAPMHPYYAQDPAHPRFPSRQPHQPRIDPHNPSQPPMPFPMGAHGVPSPYGGSPFHHEVVPFAPNAYYRDPYAMVPGMLPQPYFPSYPQVSSPTQAESRSPAPASAPTPASASGEAPAEAAKDTAKDEAIARLEKLILDERTDRENKEAARLAAIEREAAEKAAREQQLAHDRKIAAEAASLARADAEKKAAEDAAKAKEEAEKAAAAAASEAAAAATVAAAEATAAAAEKAAAEKAAAEKAEAEEKAKKAAPAEKKKPIKFKDAVGRKFSFPFELCNTWKGMEDLIKQAFLHIEVIGPHVAEGHYDLVGPNGDIILPQVWETVVEPDWAITMHMWPIPEKPKEADPPAAADPPPAASAAPAKPAAPEKKKEGTKKAPRKPGEPAAFAQWMMGRRPPPRAKQAPKAEKKPDPAPQ